MAPTSRVKSQSASPHDLDVFFLGAGRPARGRKPSALKEISAKSRALDWQLQSLSALENPRVHFLGGYHVEEIIKDYPNLHYTLIPDWEHQAALQTFLAAPLSSQRSALFLYSDTVFRQPLIARTAATEADVVVVYDSSWQSRYTGREAVDLDGAEKILLDDKGATFSVGRGVGRLVEFTGLIKLSPRAVACVEELVDDPPGRTILDLLQHLADSGFSFKYIDALGDWAEFNSPRDVARFVLGTKADTLRRIAPLLKSAVIGDQTCFSVADWKRSSDDIIEGIQAAFSNRPLVVRSSAEAEDGWQQSNAGGFASVLDVASGSVSEIREAVETVISSYLRGSPVHTDQVLIQEFISDVRMSGVIFTRSLETGAPYYRINFDDTTSSTESVTQGSHSELRTVVIARNAIDSLKSDDPDLAMVLDTVCELEKLLGYDRLDIEFAVTQQGTVQIFQVRPITIDHGEFDIDDPSFENAIQTAMAQFKRYQEPTPFIVGKRSVFGVMPDWNPAEIIGTRPNPLAFSLYRHLITDEIWAAQRAEFGYRDVRPHPLIVAFAGQPYVDIRASLNSFIPRSVSDETAEALVNAYVETLEQNPHFHDKLEFELAFTVLSPSFDEEVEARLLPHGVSPAQIAELREGLKEITREAFNRLERDLEPIATLAQRQVEICGSALRPLDKAVALIEDCRRFGTLAFSHAARGGFIAAIMLRGLVTRGAMDEDEFHLFMESIKTVAGEFEGDARSVAVGEMAEKAYVEKYGHLRPGTYDITVSAYWEAPDRFLLPKIAAATTAPPQAKVFTAKQPEKIAAELDRMGLGISSTELFEYSRKTIQAREWAKFEFTRNLSKALDMICEFGREADIKREDLALLSYQDILGLKVGTITPAQLPKRIEEGQRASLLTQVAELPQLLMSTRDFLCFERNAAQPNFVTTKMVEAEAVRWTNSSQALLDGKIVLIEQADPGFDWLFAYDIAGLITKYGGANSHMAIRAAEQGLPAAIGVGDLLFDQLADSDRIQLNCGNCQVRRIE